VLDVGFAHALKTLLLDEEGDAREPRPHVFGQRLHFLVDGLVQGLNCPVQMASIPKKIYESRAYGLPLHGDYRFEIRARPEVPALERSFTLIGSISISGCLCIGRRLRG